MSTYLSYRRRYSAPEKPEPRFQWRLRVHSLMMDDSDNTSTISDRRIQRPDSSSRDLGRDYGYDADNREMESSDNPDSAVAHRNRRDRFTRTKSEGHLKLRVRFSKCSDTSKSFDDDDEPRMYAEQERRRCRSSQESGIGSFGEHHTDEEEDRSEKHQTSQSEDNSDDDDGFVGEDSSGAVGGSENFHDNENCGSEEKDVSKGAIPKRYSNTGILKSDSLYQSNKGEEQELSMSIIGTSSRPVEQRNFKKYENSLDVSDKKEESGSFPSNLDNRREFVAPTPAINDGQHRCKEAEYKTKYTTNTEETSGEHITNGAGKRKADDSDNVDDIESILERIIAEEEAMLAGKEKNSTFAKTSDGRLSDDRVTPANNEVTELRDDAKNEKENDQFGISITRSTSQDKQRSSSLPSCDGDHCSPKTFIPFSSSCPSSQINVPQKQSTEEEDEAEDDGWAYLPVILLEDVFTLLSPKERHQASQVCRQWYDLFYSPRVWETFILLERTLTKKRFNLYKGYQRELCPGKTQLCFRRVGSFFKRIVVTPITDYFNLYEFLRILAAFLQYQEDHGLAAMPLLHTFDFTFACASRGDGEVIVHGTGGQILEMIKQLLIRISNLKHLKLNQLLVDETDVPGLFDAMGNCFSECLSSLEMLNVTKVPLGLTDLARFRNLVKLTVSPQHLNEEVLLLIAGLNLLQLHLLQDPYTCDCEPVSYEAWKLVREMAPWLRVYLELSGNTRAQLLIQPRAPVYGVFLRTPYSRLTNDLVMSLVEYYSKTLRYFVQERLPRVHGPRGIDARCDSSLLFLVRRCLTLHTLVIRERISTSTLILLANEGKSLTTLLVRKHALIKRCDWPQPGVGTKEFYSRLRKCSLDYDKCTDEVCTLLRRRWRPLTDKQFMRLKIIPRAEMF